MTRMALSLLIIFLLNLCAWRYQTWPYPSIAEMHFDHRTAIQDVSALSLGLRRMAANLKFIQLLTYYGGHGTEDTHAHHHGPDYGKGHYPEIYPRTVQILDMDPYFQYATLYSAGSLAFNLDMPEQALELLYYALGRDPKEWKYGAYAAAIGFHKKGDALEVIQILTPILREPDCPALLKNLLAFLNRKIGRHEEAARIYRMMLEDSRDLQYRELARKALEKISADAY